MAASIVSCQQAAGLRSCPLPLTRSPNPESLPGACMLSFGRREWSVATEQLHKFAQKRFIPHAKRHASLKLRAEASASGAPESLSASATFYKIEAILRPWRVTYATQALLSVGIRGATISDVRGFGAQGASKEREAGSEFSDADFLAKVKLEVVVVADQVDAVVDAIIDASRTGEYGDGKIFVSPVSEIVRIRTGERGVDAERMKGGRADLLAQKTPLA